MLISETEWYARVETEFQAGNLTRTWRDVLRALMTFRGKDGIRPSQESIAKRAGCSDRTVRRALTQAKQLDMAWWLPRGPSRKRRDTNRYTLNVPDRPIKPGMRPAFPKPPTTGQVGPRVPFNKNEGLLKGMIAEAARAGDLLTARRDAMMARFRAGGRLLPTG